MMKMKKLALLFMTGGLLLSAVPCYGAEGGVKTKTSSVSASTAADYTQIPGAKTLQTDIGFVPKVPDTLTGGYKFSSGSIVESYDVDADGSKVNQKKGINFKYTMVKGDTVKTVTFSAMPQSGQSISDNSTVTKYGQTELYFNSQYANYVGWFENGIYYNLMDINKAVTKEEMIAMAKGIIDETDFSNAQ